MVHMICLYLCLSLFSLSLPSSLSISHTNSNNDSNNKQLKSEMLKKISIIVHNFSPSAKEMEEGRSDGQAQPLLYRELRPAWATWDKTT